MSRRLTWAEIKVTEGLSPEAQRGYAEAAAAFEFGRAVRKARIQRGLGQSDLARRMGTSQSAVARLEAGGATPTLRTIARAAKALDMSFGVAPDHIWSELHNVPPGGRAAPTIA